MPRILEKNINTSEHYNKGFSNRKFEIDYNEPLRAGALLERFNGGRFLDVGCGVATHCQLAEQKSSEVWGIDFADKLIESLRVRFPTINYVVGDFRDLPFKNDFFDYIVMGEVLEHMEEPNKVLKNVVDLLKVGGTLAVSTPESDNGIFSVEEHIWSFTESELGELLKPYGEVYSTILTERAHNFIVAYLTKR